MRINEFQGFFFNNQSKYLSRNDLDFFYQLKEENPVVFDNISQNQLLSTLTQSEIVNILKFQNDEYDIL